MQSACQANSTFYGITSTSGQRMSFYPLSHNLVVTILVSSYSASSAALALYIWTTFEWKSALTFKQHKQSLTYLEFIIWLDGIWCTDLQKHHKPVLIWWCFFPRMQGFWENVQQFISTLCFFSPLLRPGSVHSGSVSWDDCDWVFPDELHVS